MRSRWMCLMWGLVCGVGSTVSAAEWGDLSGRFVLDKMPPAPEKLKITKDEDYCCKFDLKSETLVVNPDNRGLRNLIVYLSQDKPGLQAKASDKPEVPIHESYLPLAKEKVLLDNNSCRFDPHVALVWTQQTVVLGNSDPIGHNVKIDCIRNTPSNLTVPGGGEVERTFSTAERMPVRVSCSIHPWMGGWIVVRDTPYMAVTDADGKFEIKNLPVGEWQFFFWHETAGYVDKVKIKGKPEDWKRGIAKFTIKPGQQDLGDIVLGLDLFSKK